uniref:ShKT domain-containing protein n=1 Tax=Rhabditophanes sp. KR3021 TaxID=114890 RepID=A0AC35UF21_9BILA
MNFYLNILIQLILVNYVLSKCAPITFSSTDLPAYGFSHASNPFDSIFGNQCNDGSLQIVISTVPGFNLLFQFSEMSNLELSNASFNLYDGNKISGIPFCTITGGTLFTCPRSVTNEIFFVYQIRGDLISSLPEFEINVSSILGIPMPSTTAAPCSDKLDPTGQNSCHALIHLCNDPVFGPLMKSECPVTCHLCPV